MTSDHSRGGWLHRMTSLGVPLMVLLLLSATAFALVVRYTELFDPVATTPGLTSMERFHTGAPPCLRYPSEPDAGSLDQGVRALAASGLGTSEFRELVGDVYARAESREAAQHPRSEPDEYLDAMAEHASLLGRVAVALKRDRYREKLGKTLAIRPPVTRTIASLPEAHHAAFELQWARDPSLFVFPGLGPFLERLAVAATARKLDAAQAVLERRAVEGGELTLQALPPGEREDDWGSAFELEPSGEGLELASLGRDRMRGGTGPDADQVRLIHVAKKPEALAPVLACEGKTVVVLKRAELDDSLQNLDDSVKTVRVTPAFKDGVSTGFRLTHLQPTSILAHAGLCEGDVINAVNGLPIDSPDKALEAYSAIRNANRIEVQLTRAGKPTLLTIQLK